MSLRLKSQFLPPARLAPALQVKFAGAPDGQIEGHASVFGGPPDAYGDIIAPGAFTRTIQEHKAAGTMPAMLWSHDASLPIGRWTSMTEDSRGLAVKGVLNLATAQGREAFALLTAGDVTGVSIGWMLPPGGATRNPDGTQTLTDVEVVEISLVALPANKRARVTLASKGDLVDLLQKSGLAKQAAVRVAAGGWDALTKAPENHASAAAERIKKAAEKLRQA